MALRAPRIDEADRVHALLVARDTADLGRPDLTLQDLLEEWSASGFRLGDDAVVWEEGNGRLCGYAVVRRGSTYGAVHPEEEEKGIGAALLEWCERRQRELGWETHSTAVAGANERAVALVRSRGYTLMRSYWRMVRELDGAPNREPPPGVTLRCLEPDGDARAVYELDRAAFATVAGSEEESLDAFTEEHLQAHDLDTGLSLLAEREERAVGFALVRRREQESAGSVDLLAVDPAVHGRGIGRSLLLGAFAAMREAGLVEGQLGVAADNASALQLYEGVGMRPRFRLDVYTRAV